MRYTFLLFALICSTILFTANTSIKDGLFANFVFMGGEDPKLPEVPFDYEVNDFPEHLLNTEWGNNDSTVFDFITNDGATLGRVLFYDELLSANNNLSCATCHSQELSFADKTPFSMGVSTATDVNSMHLNDLGWSNNIGFFWDMSHSNLEEMIALPLENPNEIGVSDIDDLTEKLEETSYYPDLFSAAYGSSEITQEKIQLAISQFISAMTTFNSRFDQSKKGEFNFTQQEVNGELLFLEHCSICHTDGKSFFFDFIIDVDPMDPELPLLIAPHLFDNGLLLKEGDSGAGAWNEQFEGLFKAPTLRNIEKTGPYMHDGRFSTLEEVIDYYSEDIGESVVEWGSSLPAGGFNFDDYQKEELIAFLLTMTDEQFLTDIKFSDPFSKFTDAEELLPVSSINVFPNPTTGPLNISFDNFEQRNVEVYLMGIDGKMIRQLSSHRNGLSTDISLLPKGVYVARVMTGEEEWEDHKVVLN